VSVGGVLEHLPHDFATRPRILEPLALHEGRNSVLVREEEVDAPAIRTGIRAGDRHLPLDQEPAPRVLWIDLVAWKEIRVHLKDPLKLAVFVLAADARHCLG
jgi:hypothetical protein